MRGLVDFKGVFARVSILNASNFNPTSVSNSEF